MDKFYISLPIANPKSPLHVSLSSHPEDPQLCSCLSSHPEDPQLCSCLHQLCNAFANHYPVSVMCALRHKPKLGRELWGAE